MLNHHVALAFTLALQPTKTQNNNSGKRRKERQNKRRARHESYYEMSVAVASEFILLIPVFIPYDPIAASPMAPAMKGARPSQ